MQEIYRTDKSYQWNYDNGPSFEGPFPELKKSEKKFKLWNFELNSPLGIPAGPLLDSKWINLYGKLGFDIPVYKTVRTIERECHPNPNCVFVDAPRQLDVADIGGDITTRTTDPTSVENITITNSFGVPSQPPSVWMADIERANNSLGEGQVMIVSIMGTPGEGRDLVQDYANCAQMAKEAGAKIIEANYSCPNICTDEGSLYKDLKTSSKISKAIREVIGDTPFLIKMGMLAPEELRAVVEANLPFVDGFAGINTIAMDVRTPAGEQALPGANRLRAGLCGEAIRDAGLAFTKELAKIRKEKNADFVICGVGGMMNAQDLQDRLDAGADIVMSATSAMWDPNLARDFRNL